MKGTLKDILQVVALTCTIGLAILGYEYKNMWISGLYGLCASLYVQLGHIKTKD